MCNRYGLHSPLSKLQDVFAFTEEVRHVPRWNIAPSSEILVIHLRPDGTREPLLVRWGLQPSHGTPVVNARVETAAEKPLFREAMRERRVLVPADGFFEWKHEGERKQPFWIQVDGGEPFGMGALYEPPRHADEPGAIVILTTDANATLEGIHDRMPVIVPREAQADWLDPATPLATLEPVLKPLPPKRTRRTRVDTKVNNVRNDGPDLLDPPRQQSLF